MEETIKAFRCDLAFSDIMLPETIFEKVELYDLRLALGKAIESFINLTIDEYKLIKDKLVMDTIRIKVSDYYGNPSYYSVMPQAIFDALEAFSLNGEEYAVVDKKEFNKMIEEHEKKMKQCETQNS